MKLRVALLASLIFASFGFVGAAASPVKSVVLEGTQDTYVVTDTSTQDDPQGLRDRNFATSDSVRVWYQSKVQASEQVISIGMVGFDLKAIQDLDVDSATLQMYAQRVDITQPKRVVDASIVQGPWKESDVTFNRKPAWAAQPIASSVIYGGGRWYSWDVTATVALPRPPATVSYAIGLNTIQDKQQEQVLFTSHRGGTNMPRLIVTYRPASSGTAWYVWAGGAVGISLAAALLGGWISSRFRRAPRAGGSRV